MGLLTWLGDSIIGDSFQGIKGKVLVNSVIINVLYMIYILV